MNVEQSRTYFRDIASVAIDGIVNPEATTEQQDRFAGALLRAMEAVIDAKIEERLAVDRATAGKPAP